MSKQKNKTNNLDKRLLALALVLTVAGLVFLADASAPLAEHAFNNKFYFVKQQLVWAAIGVIVLFICTKIRYTFWEKIATPLFFLALATLFIVLIPGIGSKILGARRWLLIGPISVQPSEFIKFALALYFAKVADKNRKLAAFVIPLGLIGMLVMLQPDLGTMMVIAIIGFAQIFVSGVNMLHFFSLGFLGMVISFILIITSGYRRDRLLTFFQQTQDPLGKSYHIRQILLALGSGGLFGVGLGQSRQKYLFLPETATDSIFAIIAEEVGFLGGCLLIILFILFTLRVLKIANNAPNTFTKVFAVGIAAWIGGQAFLNIASMVALVPLTGIPLPFISYGGSALVSVLAATGILLNISQHASTKK